MIFNFYKNKSLNSQTINKYYNMTYILAGSFNNENFLMVDTIEDNDIKEKIYKSITNKNVYLSLTGDNLLMNLIQLYEDWLYHYNKQMIFDINTINLISKEYESLISYRNNNGYND